ncbi:MAG: hypothetical protein HY343_06275, partial [Lentisphaerae bacterium]|nr:hypothetical protein [Lentisphaerota bacterium]
ARCGRRVWDATEGGARKAGTRIVDLKTALTESLGAAAAAKPRVTGPAAKTGADAGRPQLERWRKSAGELTLQIQEALRGGLLMEREPAPFPFLSPHEELLDLVSSVINPCLMAELFWAWDDWVTDRQGIVQRPDEVGERYLREILLSMDLLIELLAFDGAAGAAPSGKAITFCRGKTVSPAWAGFVKWLQQGPMETMPFMGDFDHIPLIWKIFRHFGSDIAVLLDGAIFPAAWTWPGRICLDFRTQPPDDKAGFMASEFWIPGYAAIGCDARVEAAWKSCMPADRPLCRLEQREGQFRLMSGETPIELKALLARLRAEVR